MGVGFSLPKAAACTGTRRKFQQNQCLEIDLAATVTGMDGACLLPSVASFPQQCPISLKC
jgi:hypothetical protein